MPPRRISSPTILLTVVSGLDGGSYLLAGALFIGLAIWAGIDTGGRGLVVACLAVGVAALALVAYRVATLGSTARYGSAAAVVTTAPPARARPTFTPWGDMSGIGDRQGAGAYEVSYRSLESSEQGSVRLQEAWVKSLATGSQLWLLTHGRHRLIAPRAVSGAGALPRRSV